MTVTCHSNTVADDQTPGDEGDNEWIENVSDNNIMIQLCKFVYKVSCNLYKEWPETGNFCPQ